MDWNAVNYFSSLTARNKLARKHNFYFCPVSGIENIEGVLHRMQNTANFVCVSETVEGGLNLNNTPHTRRIKDVFIIMRHQIDNIPARNECMAVMNELLRQFMSDLQLENTRLDNSRLYLEPQVRFTELPQYLFSGCAAIRFQVVANIYTDLQFNTSEWID